MHMLYTHTYILLSSSFLHLAPVFPFFSREEGKPPQQVSCFPPALFFLLLLLHGEWLLSINCCYTLHTHTHSGSALLFFSRATTNGGGLRHQRVRRRRRPLPPPPRDHVVCVRAAVKLRSWTKQAHGTALPICLDRCRIFWPHCFRYTNTMRVCLGTQSYIRRTSGHSCTHTAYARYRKTTPTISWSNTRSSPSPPSLNNSSPSGSGRSQQQHCERVCAKLKGGPGYVVVVHRGPLPRRL